MCDRKVHDGRKDSGDTRVVICTECRQSPSQVQLLFSQRLNYRQKQFNEINELCRLCTIAPTTDEVSCTSLDCPLMFRRHTARNLLVAARGQMKDIEDLLL